MLTNKIGFKCDFSKIICFNLLHEKHFTAIFKIVPYDYCKKSVQFVNIRLLCDFYTLSCIPVLALVVLTALRSVYPHEPD